MDTQTFLGLIFTLFGVRSILSLYKKAQEVLTALEIDETVEDTFTGERIKELTPLQGNADRVRQLRRNITYEAVRKFLTSQESYAINKQPEKRKDFNWTTVADRYIKWQTDTIYLGKHLKRQLGWMIEKPQGKRAKLDPKSVLESEDRGFNYILTIIDSFTKYAFVVPLKTREGAEVAMIFHRLFSSQYKNITPFKPKLLLSDKGTELENRHLNFVCKHHYVFQIVSASARPLGIIERFNQTMKRKLKKAIDDGRITGATFEDGLARLVNEYNNTEHSTTHFKPAFAHFVEDETAKRVVSIIAGRLKEIKRKNDEKHAKEQRILHATGSQVRVLAWKDPTLSALERNEIKQAFTFKRFARAFWSKRHFTISKVLPNQYYLLEGYSMRFHQVELQAIHV